MPSTLPSAFQTEFPAPNAQIEQLEPMDITKIDMPKSKKSAMELAMEATLKNLAPTEVPKPVETTTEDDEVIKQSQAQKFRELLQEKVTQQHIYLLVNSLFLVQRRAT